MLHVPYMPVDEPRDVEMQCDLTFHIEVSEELDCDPDFAAALEADWAGIAAELLDFTGDDVVLIEARKTKVEWVAEMEVNVDVEVRLLFRGEQESKETMEERWSNDDWNSYTDALAKLVPGPVASWMSGTATVTDMNRKIAGSNGEVVVRPVADGDATARIVGNWVTNALAGLRGDAEGFGDTPWRIGSNAESLLIATITRDGFTVGLFQSESDRYWRRAIKSDFLRWERDLESVDRRFTDHLVDSRLHLLEILSGEFGHSCVELWPSFTSLPAWTPFEQDMAVDLAMVLVDSPGLQVERIELQHHRNAWERPGLLTAARFDEAFERRTAKPIPTITRTTRVEVDPVEFGCAPTEGLRLWQLVKH